MALHTVTGHRVADDVDDLKTWLRELTGCPPITHTMAATCPSESHGDEPATWFYVEGDPLLGIARRRCVACATVRPVLDSESHWEHPPMWACESCQNSLAEVAFGVHAEPSETGPVANWLAVAVRCVACGRVFGITDLFVPNLSLEEIASRI